ncbi:MAG: DUF4160 domain-containing protein [Oceanipulchritudo sp.]
MVFRESKFWLEPEISLAKRRGISDKDLGNIRKILNEHKNTFKQAWRFHFGDPC